MIDLNVSFQMLVETPLLMLIMVSLWRELRTRPSPRRA
jgi:hypothetical protein